MPAEDLFMVIDKGYFTVKLRRSLLEVDLKRGARKELEDAVEANPALRDTLGFVFQSMIPLDVPIKRVESVECDDKGLVRVRVPRRRDIKIPLEPSDGRRLAEKMNQLILMQREEEAELRRRRAIMDIY